MALTCFAGAVFAPPRDCMLHGRATRMTGDEGMKEVKNFLQLSASLEEARVAHVEAAEQKQQNTQK